MKRIIGWPSATELVSDSSLVSAQIASERVVCVGRFLSEAGRFEPTADTVRTGWLPEEDFFQHYDKCLLFVLFDKDRRRKYNESYETELLFQESISHLCVAPILVFYLGDLSLGQFLRGRPDLGDGPYPARPSGRRRYPPCL